MSDENTEEVAADPIKAAGFDSAEDMVKKMETLNQQVKEKESKIGSQSSEVGEVRKENAALKEQLDKLAPQVAQILERGVAAPVPVAPPVEVDWKDKKEKMFAKLPEDLQAKLIAEEPSPEEAEMLKTDEGKYHFMNELLKAQGVASSEGGSKSPFAGLIPTAPQPSLQDQIKAMIRGERDAQRRDLPISGSAQAGNANALSGSTNTGTMAKPAEQKPKSASEINASLDAMFAGNG